MRLVNNAVIKENVMQVDDPNNFRTICETT